MAAADVFPLLDAVGGKGMYLAGISGLDAPDAAEKLMAAVGPYR